MGDYSHSVSLNDDGKVLAIGSTYASYGGAAWVYDWKGGRWIKRGDTFIGEKVFDDFGISISLDGGDTVAIVREGV